MKSYAKLCLSRKGIIKKKIKTIATFSEGTWLVEIQWHHCCLHMGLHFISKLKSRGAEKLSHWLTVSPSKENWFLIGYLGSHFAAPPCTLLFSAISYDVLGTLYSFSFVKHFVSNYFCINLSQARAYSLMTISMFFCVDKNIEILAQHERAREKIYKIQKI